MEQTIYINVRRYSPHAQHFDDSLFLQNLVHQPVLNVDPSGVRSGEISDELLESGRRLERIGRQEVE